MAELGRTGKVLKAQEEARCQEGTPVARGSLSQVLSDLITSQGLSAGAGSQSLGQPSEKQFSLLSELTSEATGAAETEQEDPIDLSRQGTEAEQLEGTLDIEKMIKENNELWAKFSNIPI